MSPQNTARETFIHQCRRESQWSIPLLSLGALVMMLVPLLLDATPLATLAAAMLTALFGYGALSAARILRASDETVLFEASKRHLVGYAVVAAAMGLFSVGTGADVHWVLWTTVVALTVQANEKRVSQARAHARQ